MVGQVDVLGHDRQRPPTLACEIPVPQSAVTG
jgi:hypothetical protein